MGGAQAFLRERITMPFSSLRSDSGTDIVSRFTPPPCSHPRLFGLALELSMNKLDVNSDMYRIVGCAMKVRHNLGSGFSESVYEKAFQMELEEAGFSARLQVRIPVFYKGVNLHRDYVADVLVNDSIIVELKAVRCLAKVHEEQIGHYLEATGLKEGLLVNFGNKRGLEWRVY